MTRITRLLLLILATVYSILPNVEASSSLRKYVYQKDISEHCRRRVMPSVFIGRQVVEANAQILHFSNSEVPYSCYISVRAESGSNIIIVIQTKLNGEENFCNDGSSSPISVYEMSETFGGYWGPIPDSLLRTEPIYDAEYYTIKTTTYATTVDSSDDEAEEEEGEDYVVQETTTPKPTKPESKATVDPRHYMTVEVPIMNVSAQFVPGKVGPSFFPESVIFDDFFDVAPRPGVTYHQKIVPLVQFSVAPPPPAQDLDAQLRITNTTDEEEKTPVDIGNQNLSEPRYQVDFNFEGITLDPRLLYNVPASTESRGKKFPFYANRRFNFKKGKKYPFMARRKNKNQQWSEIEALLKNLTELSKKEEDGEAKNITDLFKKIADMYHNQSVYLAPNLSMYAQMSPPNDSNLNTSNVTKLTSVKSVFPKNTKMRQMDSSGITLGYAVGASSTESFTDILKTQYSTKESTASTETTTTAAIKLYRNDVDGTLITNSSTSSTTPTIISVPTYSTTTLTTSIQTSTIPSNVTNTAFTSSTLISTTSSIPSSTIPNSVTPAYSAFTSSIPTSVTPDTTAFTSSTLISTTSSIPTSVTSANTAFTSSTLISTTSSIPTSVTPDNSAFTSSTLISTTSSIPSSSIPSSSIPTIPINPTNTILTKNIPNNSAVDVPTSTISSEANPTNAAPTKTVPTSVAPIVPNMDKDIPIIDAMVNTLVNKLLENKALEADKRSSTTRISSSTNVKSSEKRFTKKTTKPLMTGALRNRESWDNVLRVAPKMAGLLDKPEIVEIATSTAKHRRRKKKRLTTKSSRRLTRKKRFIQAIPIFQAKPHNMTREAEVITKDPKMYRFADMQDFAQLVEPLDDDIHGHVILRYMRKQVGDLLFDMCSTSPTNWSKNVFLFNTSRIILALNNFTLPHMSVVVTPARILTMPEMQCTSTTLECQVNGARVCIGNLAACDGIPNCGAYDVYDEDRQRCGKVTSVQHNVYVAAFTFLAVLCTVLYAVHYWLKRCVPKVSEAFFVYSNGVENVLHLKTVMKSPLATCEDTDKHGYRAFYENEFDLIRTMKVSLFTRLMNVFRKKKATTMEAVELEEVVPRYSRGKTFSFPELEIRKMMGDWADAAVQTGDSLEMQSAAKDKESPREMSPERIDTSSSQRSTENSELLLMQFLRNKRLATHHYNGSECVTIEDKQRISHQEEEVECTNYSTALVEMSTVSISEIPKPKENVSLPGPSGWSSKRLRFDDNLITIPSPEEEEDNSFEEIEHVELDNTVQDTGRVRRFFDRNMGKKPKGNQGYKKSKR